MVLLFFSFQLWFIKIVSFCSAFFQSFVSTIDDDDGALSDDSDGGVDSHHLAVVSKKLPEASASAPTKFLSTASLSTSDVLYEGSLKKYTSKLMGWKRRHFSLCGTELVYSKSVDDEIKAKIDIANSSIAEQSAKNKVNAFRYH